MGYDKTLSTSARDHLGAISPDHPVMFFSPETLQATARRFQAGFPGLVSYAVKANPARVVIENLAAAGIGAFDVASPVEIRAIARIAPGATLHYNNPVRTRREIAAAAAAQVASYSVDSRTEIDKLAAIVAPRGTEICVRLRLAVEGGAYDFGSKFGADPEEAASLLSYAAGLGFTASMTFHPGTQCTAPDAWSTYIDAAARVAHGAGVRLARLNVGGGFPSHRNAGGAPELETTFATIARATTRAFPDAQPELVCEPGRAMVAEAFTLATRVKALRDDGSVFLNDGIYGALSEMLIMGATDRITVLSPTGERRTGPACGRVVFGPTCDSLDRLPGKIALPADIAEDDYVLFAGMGAYSSALATAFNGYGTPETVSVRTLVI